MKTNTKKVKKNDLAVEAPRMRVRLSAHFLRRKAVQTVSGKDSSVSFRTIRNASGGGIGFARICQGVICQASDVWAHAVADKRAVVNLGN